MLRGILCRAMVADADLSCTQQLPILTVSWPEDVDDGAVGLGISDGDHGDGFVFGGIEGYTSGVDGLDSETAQDLVELVSDHADSFAQRLVRAIG